MSVELVEPGPLSEGELQNFMNNVALQGKGYYRWQQNEMKGNMWESLSDVQLKQVEKKREAHPNSKSVISFNVFFKNKYLTEMLKKLVHAGEENPKRMDVVCLQEMCGPWLVSETTHDYDSSKPVEQTEINGRLLSRDELYEMIKIVDAAAAAAGKLLEGGAEVQSPPKVQLTSEGQSSAKFPFLPSIIRKKDHLAGAIDSRNNKLRLNWYRDKNTLANYITLHKDALINGDDVEDISGSRGFSSIAWGKWWLENFDNYQLDSDEKYITADFNENSGMSGYSMIFVPANHTNGFYLCSFGNAIIYKKADNPTPDPDIFYSKEPLPDDVILEGRIALKVELSGINYICTHLDEKASWKSQYEMLEKWINDKGLFNGRCIICGDMNVMNLSVEPMKTLIEIEKNKKSFPVGRGSGTLGYATIETPLPSSPEKTYKDRSVDFYQLFKNNGIRSIYEDAERSNMYIRTVANGAGIDFVGYTTLENGGGIKPLQTGVIYPVLSVAASDPNKFCISDHWLPFLVFSESENSTQQKEELKRKIRIRRENEKKKLQSSIKSTDRNLEEGFAVIEKKYELAPKFVGGKKSRKKQRKKSRKKQKRKPLRSSKRSSKRSTKRSSKRSTKRSMKRSRKRRNSRRKPR